MPLPERFRASLELVVFDLDGTLTKSKSPMDAAMAKLIARLLQKKSVAVIGGGRWLQFERQFVKKLRASRGALSRLFLFPATATVFYRYTGKKWEKVYAHTFTPHEKQKIRDAFARVFRELHYAHPAKTFGPVIEDRDTQITFSALGQSVVERLGDKGVALKEAWRKKNNTLRMRMRARLQKYLPEFSVRAGGTTSLDITKKGIDKAYGIRMIERELGISRRNMVFVGDALYPGGNDHAARRTGVTCVPVKGPAETMRFIRKILA